jgi:dGTPase
MIRDRREREELEDRMLAPYAARSPDSLGRRHAEEPHHYRTQFQRDRDRVIHSRAFRRLEYKTQVFVNGTADHYRTRLTHTMEMAAVGRTLARILRANEDLTEAIALAHDLGHSPFGHRGEEALDGLMKNEGGFDHNVQSCRCVELLEYQYPRFQGLNLTWEVRAGLRKHQTSVAGAELDGMPIGPFQMIEAQIADIADDMTYQAHDVDDALEAGIIRAEDLAKLDLWRLAGERTRAQYGDAISADQHFQITLRNLLDVQVSNVIVTSADRLARYKPGSPREVMEKSCKMVDFSKDMKEMLQPYRSFLYQKIYYSAQVGDDSEIAIGYMRRLFLHYIENPDTMGCKARARLEREGLWRTACDYVAGMTDRYALEEYYKFGLNAKEEI